MRRERKEKESDSIDTCTLVSVSLSRSGMHVVTNVNVTNWCFRKENNRRASVFMS